MRMGTTSPCRSISPGKASTAVAIGVRRGEAPLKENVAAGMLMRSGWGEMAASGAQFLDPMCGSGRWLLRRQ